MRGATSGSPTRSAARLRLRGERRTPRREPGRRGGQAHCLPPARPRSSRADRGAPRSRSISPPGWRSDPAASPEPSRASGVRAWLNNNHRSPAPVRRRRPSKRPGRPCPHSRDDPRAPASRNGSSVASPVVSTRALRAHSGQPWPTPRAASQNASRSARQPSANHDMREPPVRTYARTARSRMTRAASGSRSHLCDARSSFGVRRPLLTRGIEPSVMVPCRREQKRRDR